MLPLRLRCCRGIQMGTHHIMSALHSSYWRTYQTALSLVLLSSLLAVPMSDKYWETSDSHLQNCCVLIGKPTSPVLALSCRQATVLSVVIIHTHSTAGMCHALMLDMCQTQHNRVAPKWVLYLNRQWIELLLLNATCQKSVQCYISSQESSHENAKEEQLCCSPHDFQMISDPICLMKF